VLTGGAVTALTPHLMCLGHLSHLSGFSIGLDGLLPLAPSLLSVREHLFCSEFLGLGCAFQRADSRLISIRIILPTAALASSRTSIDRDFVLWCYGGATLADF